MRGLAEDRSIIIKSADKGSCVVVWDRADYLAEAENHLSHGSTYKKVKLGEEELVRLVEQSNGMFKQLLSKKSISSEDYKYFSHAFKKSINLQNVYFLPKIHKRLDRSPDSIKLWYADCKDFRIFKSSRKPLMQSAKT